MENLSLLPDRSDTKMVTGRKNMIHLLVQGLHSRDATILRSVFGRNDPEMIQQTVERIPAQYLGALLSEMSYLMQMKTVQYVAVRSTRSVPFHALTSFLSFLFFFVAYKRPYVGLSS